VEADPELRRRFWRERDLDHLLAQALRPEAAPSAFERGVLRRLEKPPVPSAVFTQDVVRKVLEAGPKRTARRFGGARGAGAPPNWIPTLAAGVLIVIVLVLLFSRSGPEPRPVARPEPERPREPVAAPAPQDRREAEARLATLREEELKAEQARKAAQDEERRRQAEEEFLAIVRKRKEQEERIRKLREEEAAREAVKPPPTPPKPSTLAATVKVLKADKAVVVTAEGNTPLKGGEDLLPGQTLDVGEKGSAVVGYQDKTRLELGPQSELRNFAAVGGKRVFVARGTVRAIVERQPEGQAMVLATPHGEAKVVGTTFRLAVDPDPKKGTRLDVEEGKVQLSSAGASVLVERGHYAVAAAATELRSRPVREMVMVLRFDFENGRLPQAWAKGRIAPGPSRTGNQYCLTAEIDDPKTDARGVWRYVRLEQQVGDPLTVVDGMTFGFDYWIEGGETISLLAWNVTRAKEATLKIERVTQRRWARADVLLSEFRPEPAPGDVLGIHIGADLVQPSAFHVDNVEIARPRR
jgi:hypothetical protein